MFATHGYKIVGVDIRKEVVDALNEGKIIIEEPYLDVMVQSAVSSGNLVARTKPEEADVFIIAVGTPINEDKTADMSAVIAAAESIVPYLREGNTVILESTSPPRTVEDLLLPILAKSGLDVRRQLYVAHSPERVMPGRILQELVDNNRIIGGINRESCEVVRDLYRAFVKGEIYLTTATVAEVCKLMENTFRDVNIALANELAILCERLGVNVWDVIRYANKHPRVNLHLPGPGVGGHCIAVDPWFMVEKAPDLARLMALSRNTNDGMPSHVAQLVDRITGNVQGSKKVTILGMTYKANVDDIRESPIIRLVHILESKNYVVNIVDPHVKEYRGLEKDLYTAAKGSHLVILGVNHNEFADIDFSTLKQVMALPNVLDTRNFWDRKKVTASGFNYYLLGDGTTLQNL